MPCEPENEIDETDIPNVKVFQKQFRDKKYLIFSKFSLFAFCWKIEARNNAKMFPRELVAFFRRL